MSQELRETEKELRDLCRRYAVAVCDGKMMFYDPDGTRGHPTGHHAHVHVSFGGADKGKL